MRIVSPYTVKHEKMLGSLKLNGRNYIMLKIKNAFLCIFVAILLSACGGGTPKGSDSDVQDLVIEITTDELKKQITPIMYQKITNVPVGLIGIKITYDGLVAKINKDRNSEVVEDINEAMDKMSISLDNIRIDNVNDEIKKSENSADITINGKSSPIQYTAQLNSNDELYVEVFGL